MLKYAMERPTKTLFMYQLSDRDVRSFHATPDQFSLMLRRQFVVPRLAMRGRFPGSIASLFCVAVSLCPPLSTVSELTDNE
jgi:hypothetical protein